MHHEDHQGHEVWNISRKERKARKGEMYVKFLNLAFLARLARKMSGFSQPESLRSLQNVRSIVSLFLSYLRALRTTMLENFRGLRKFSASQRLSDSDIPAKAQGRQVRRERQIFSRMVFAIILRTLRTWRLCGRYSEFRVRLCRAGLSVVKFGFSFLHRNTPDFAAAVVGD